MDSDQLCEERSGVCLYVAVMELVRLLGYTSHITLSSAFTRSRWYYSGAARIQVIKQ